METATTGSIAQLGQRGAPNSSDYETFLKMLTVQMQNQDPLNPVEASDFAAQLANFSAVEQQVLTNDLLTSIEARLASTGVSQLAGWVGMDVLSHAPVYFESGEISAELPENTYGDRRELVVRDANGAEVYRVLVPFEAETVTWNGDLTSGATADPGLFRLEVEDFTGDNLLGAETLALHSKVREARIGASGVELHLEGGAITRAEDVLGVRMPI